MGRVDDVDALVPVRWRAVVGADAHAPGAELRDFQFTEFPRFHFAGSSRAQAGARGTGRFQKLTPPWPQPRRHVGRGSDRRCREMENRYANWDLAEPLLDTWGVPETSHSKIYGALAQHRTIFYTPAVCCPLRE